MKDRKFIIIVALLLLLIVVLFSIPAISEQPITLKAEPEIVTSDCTGELTPSQTEGPYYKTGSPKRNSIAEGIAGEKLIVTGSVFNSNCQPVANAWLDFWQTDSTGAYDNQGYLLRGHQFTDKNGVYRLETIVPAAYEARPPHIHVKVRNGNGPILTSQLYFPNERQNGIDSIFNAALVMKITEKNGDTFGVFNFVVSQ